MAAALSRVYAGLCRRYRLTSKKCPFWLDSLFCGSTAISKTRNTGTRNTRTPEQHHSGTRNTGTLKILNLLKIREKNTGGCQSIAAIIIA